MLTKVLLTLFLLPLDQESCSTTSSVARFSHPGRTNPNPSRKALTLCDWPMDLQRSWGWWWEFPSCCSLWLSQTHCDPRHIHRLSFRQNVQCSRSVLNISSICIHLQNMSFIYVSSKHDRMFVCGLFAFIPITEFQLNADRRWQNIRILHNGRRLQKINFKTISHTVK